MIDISNPANPSIAGACYTPSYPRGVHVAGSYAYVADYNSGLQVIDISNPANPSIVGTCDTPDEAWDVDVAGSYAYVADDSSGLQVIDISGWDMAYQTLLDDSSDLGLLRQYRDQFLTKSTKGKLYTTLLYQSSEEALKVLLDNPALMRRANNLIRAHKGAVENVLNGSEGVIKNTNAVMSFLKAYGKKSPPALRFLTKEVMKEMRKKQRRGRPFLGFKLE